MPTLLKWVYDGGAGGSEEAKRRGEQRAYAGDVVVDDVLGKGLLNRLDGGIVEIEFGMGEAKEMKTRTCGHVYVLEPRPAREMLAPTGRKGAGTSSIAGMLGINVNVTAPGSRE